MSLLYLLDTNVVTHTMLGRGAELLARLAATAFGQVDPTYICFFDAYSLHAQRRRTTRSIYS